MPFVLLNIRKVLKPNGHILIRDYAYGDLAQERLTGKEQEISKNFYVRGDGTRAYYFSEDFIVNLFKESGFDVKDVSICSKQVENRSRDLVMDRRWIQAVFSLKSEEGVGLTRNIEQEQIDERFDHINLLKDFTTDAEVDMSESIVEMFDSQPSFDEIITIKPKDYSFRIRVLPREYQHTCQSTGLMLWESARFMCNIIAENPTIVAEKRVLELGCGSAGICSMISVQYAEFVVSTDGDAEALQLFRENIVSNLDQHLVEKMAIRRLVWGNKQHLQDIEELKSYKGGFEVILGTDVCYSPGAISPLFCTAKKLLLNTSSGGPKPALILCHIQRRVHEDSIVATASELGFRLKDRWNNGTCQNYGIISLWFSTGTSWKDFESAPLTILYFELQDLRA